MTGRLVFATYLAPTIRPLYEAVTASVGRTLGIETELVDGTSFDAFTRREVDLGFVCGLPYVRMPDVHPLAAPVLSGERFGGRPVYFSDVIVRGSGPARTFADLRGSSWCYNDPDSHSGFGTVLDRLHRLGETPDGYFATFEPTGFHTESIRRVAAGEFDASAVDCQVLAVAMRDDPDLAGRIRVIDQIGPSAIQPLIAAAHLEPGLRAAVREAVTAVDADPRARGGLEQALVERFVAVEPHDYDDIRRVAALTLVQQFEAKET